MDRRAFVRLSAAALGMSRSWSAPAVSSQVQISNENGIVRVKAANYFWVFEPQNGHFRVLDSKNRLITTAPLQPAVVVSTLGDPTSRQCVPGRIIKHTVNANRITFDYEGVNSDSKLSITWRFDDTCFWLEPVSYDSASAHDVVSLHYFTNAQGANRAPSLQASYLLVPGMSEASTISPLLKESVRLNQTVWLGRGSDAKGLLQQWGLPVHYFGGFGVDRANDHARNVFVDDKSNCFVCGLAELPNADLFLDLQDGSASLWLDYRSDLWKHVRGPGTLSLGAELVWAIAEDEHAAISAYYRSLVDARIIHKKVNSAKKTSTALSPQFCTWGAQVARNKTGDRLDQAFLEEIYRELKASGMKVGMFSIDDKWEGKYGNLEHAVDRLPDFEKFLDQVRADGNKIGLWAALMRCEKPAEIGLTEEQMLKAVDGTPIKGGGGSYFILDFTQPEVAKVAADLARKFMRRYKPDLLKFDFGYELPPVSQAAPKDKHWTGERMMWKGLDVVISAMREENPDLVVMYYQLSPLFLPYFDLHSPDDLFLNAGEYDVEANRRFFFSGLLGELGVPTYGSSGYDWESAPSIWFDSAPVGTIGSLNDFMGDERGEKTTPVLSARYNGIAQALRPSNTFRIVPLDAPSEGATRAAHSNSWARLEDGKVVLLAVRPDVVDSNRRHHPLRETIHCSMPVVVTSRTADDVEHANRLVVAAYGRGEVSIRRGAGRKAEVFTHHFDGTVERSHAAIENGELKLSIKEDLVEWLEIQISS